MRRHPKLVGVRGHHLSTAHAAPCERLAGDLGKQPVDVDIGVAVLAGDRVLGHHQDAVGGLQRLVEFRDEDDGRAAGRTRPQLQRDIAARRDIDALERLIEDEEVRRLRHPARHHGLLLVAAGQRRHLVLLRAADDAEIGDAARAMRAFRRRIDTPKREMRSRNGRLIFS